MNRDRLLEHDPHPHDHPEHPEHSMRESGLRRLQISLFIAFSIMLLEAVGGWLSGSLALIADATHMLADTLALTMAVIAGWLATRPKTKHRSFGYYRLEVLAALGNGLLLIGMASVIVLEAVDRLQQPHQINPYWILGIGSLGLGANLLMLRVMKHVHQANLNLKAAFLHVLGDTLSSVAVIIGSIIMIATQATWPDTFASFFVAAMILFMAGKLIFESVHVLLEGTPRHMNPDEVEARILSEIPEIKSIHDFHIWEITSNLFAMTAHLEAKVGTLADTRRLIDRLNALVRERYGIGHTTFQVEPLEDPESQRKISSRT